MSTAITIHKPQSVMVQDGMTDEQVRLIKDMIGKECTDTELQLFLYTAKRTGLDPLVRQIYAVHRWNKSLGRKVMTIQTGIDGYRVVAQRHGLAGISDVTYDSETERTPKRATVTVKKLVDGQICEFTASARWDEYAQMDKEGHLSSFWLRMPYLMLGKVAEALALRKAFPNDLAGVYTTEEMQQADTVPPEGKTEAEAIREYEKPHMAVIAKAEGWSTVEGRVSSVAEKKDLLWFDLSGQLACGDPKLLTDLDTIAVGDEVAFYGVWPESKSKKKFLDIKEVGLVLKPSSQTAKVETGDLVPVLTASVAKVESEKVQPTDDDIPF